MGTEKSLEHLAQNPLSDKVYKIGGTYLGHYKKLENINVLNRIFDLFSNLNGRPRGLVYSANAGLTSWLHEALEWSYIADNGAIDQSLYEFCSNICPKFKLTWIKTKEELRNSMPLDKKRLYDLLISSIDKEIDHKLHTLCSVDVYGSLKGEINHEHNQDQDFAIMGSIGERLLSITFMEPLCQIMTEILGLHFVHINPVEHIFPIPGFTGYRQLEPDSFASVLSLRSLIEKYENNDATFVVPGFFMSTLKKKKEIGLMPYNGSDYTAHLLHLALDNPRGRRVPTIYIKNVVGSIPKSVEGLRDFQQGAVKEFGAKPQELISDMVLSDMIRRGETLYVFDTVTKSTTTIVPSTANARLAI